MLLIKLLVSVQLFELRYLSSQKLIQISFLVDYGYDFNVDRIDSQIKDPQKYALENELPIILWWTPFTGDMGSVKDCSEGKCFLTQDRSLFGHKLNKVMLFYGTSFNESDLPVPRKGRFKFIFEYTCINHSKPGGLVCSLDYTIGKIM